MKKHLAALLASTLIASPAFAQTSPNWTYKYVPTPAQFNGAFSSKQDLLGFTPMNVNGGVFLGRLVTAPPGASTSGFNLTPGATPGLPANGDLWVTGSGLFAQVNGATVGPLIGSGAAPSFPVIHPSSGNLSGAGCNPSQAHSLWWADQNLCSDADVWQITSTDPSAIFTLSLSGSVTTGDAISLTITTGSGLCSGAGCTVTSGAAVGGDTLTTLAGKLTCAIANNASLFNLNGGSCAGGAVSPASGSTTGGYGSGNPIGYTVINGVGFAFDFNSNISLKVTSSVSGSATEVVTIGNTGCGTRCSYSLDNNPAFQMVRNSGGAPQPGSVLNAIYSIGASSACPTIVCVNYGSITNWVANSTAGSLQSAWLLQTLNAAGVANGGTFFGQGVFSNYGGAPFSAGAVVDKGPGTFNAGTAYWINNIDHIDQTGGQFRMVADGTDPIVFGASTGVGVNTVPTGDTFTSNLGGFFAGSQTPTTGSGISITGTATPSISAFNYGTATYLPLLMEGLSWDLKPSNGTGGWSLSANVFAPDTDNVTTLGTASKSPSIVYTHGLTVAGTAEIFPASGALVGTTDTQTLTGKTLDTAGTGNVFKINGTQINAVTGTGSTAVLSAAPTLNNSLAITTSSGTTSGAASLILTNDNATKDFFIQAFNSGNGSNTGFGTSKNQPISFYTNNSVRLTVTAAGGFDLGTGADPGVGNFVAVGNIKSASSSGGVGYATGAGGAVTQATSRTTGVTLNNVTGAITLVSAAGSATPASFTVTNSAVAATDIVKVVQKSGTDLYEIFVTAVAAGSFKITSFTTGGTTTEQPVFNFAVIKGSAT